MDGDGKYALTGTPESKTSIIMAITVGDVYGTIIGDISGNLTGLNGAKVTLISATGKNYTAITDDKGYFIVKCPYGSYELNVSCNGFHDVKNVYVTTNNDNAYTIAMNKVESNVILGLDNAHSMMLIGFIILVLMLILTTIVTKMSKNPESSIIIENDLAPVKIEEDETDEFKNP